MNEYRACGQAKHSFKGRAGFGNRGKQTLRLIGLGDVVIGQASDFFRVAHSVGERGEVRVRNQCAALLHPVHRRVHPACSGHVEFDDSCRGLGSYDALGDTLRERIAVNYFSSAL